MRDLRQFSETWIRGIAALIVVLAALLGAALVVGIPLLILGWLLGLSGTVVWALLFLSSVLWGPLAVGYALRYLPSKATTARTLHTPEGRDA